MGRKIINRTGEENINNQGLKMKIINYKNAHDIDVQFEDGKIRKHMRYDHFKKGEIIYDTNHLNEENINNQGLKMRIIKYNTSYDIDVQFEDGYIKKNVQYIHFKKGSIRNPYFKEYYGVGYTGETKIQENGKELKSYKVWSSMIQRCYDNKFQIKQPTYKDCKVCEEWHCYANFKKWFNKNYYELDNERVELDKDILVEGNKIYSPDTCIFAPKYINELFRNKVRDLPKGVCYYKKGNCYMVSITIYKNSKYLGSYKTIEEAKRVYDEARKEMINKVAEDYKDKIPQKLYNRLKEIYCML